MTDRLPLRDCKVTPPDTLTNELCHVINRWSHEGYSDTPDFILAQFLVDALTAWNRAVQQRESWYGRTVSRCRIGPDTLSASSVEPPEGSDASEVAAAPAAQVDLTNPIQSPSLQEIQRRDGVGAAEAMRRQAFDQAHGLRAEVQPLDVTRPVRR